MAWPWTQICLEPSATRDATMPPTGAYCRSCQSNASSQGQTSGVGRLRFTVILAGMNAMPPGFAMPVTIGVTKPVVRLVCPTNDSIGFGAVGDENTLTAEYATDGAKYGAVIEYTAPAALSATR